LLLWRPLGARSARSKPKLFDDLEEIRQG